MDPLDFRPGHALTFRQNSTFDLAASVATTVLAHPFGVLKTLWQSNGVALSTVRARHLFSGIEARLFTAPLFLVLGSTNYMIKDRLSRGGERKLTLVELFAAAGFSSLVATPLYQCSDFGIYHHNLSRINGGKASLLATIRELWKKAGARGWARTLPLTATLGVTSSMSTLAFAPYVFCKKRAEGKSYEEAYAAIILNALFYVAISQPLDTLRVRGQQDYRTPLTTIARRTFQEESLRVFWRGGLFRGLNQVAAVVSYVTFQYVFSQSLIKE